MTKEALKAAIKAMGNSNSISYEMMHAITAIKEALAQPEQEPVGFIEAKADNECADAYADGWNACVRAHKDTTPPKREWVGLTDADFCREINTDDFLAGAFFAENKLKEKNT